MIVTEIEPVSGGKRRIYLNDEAAFLLYLSDLNELHLKQGEELSKEDEKMIYSVILPKRACLRAMHILEKNDKTEHQLRQKLLEGEYPASVVDHAISYVKSYHYIDDLRFAETYIRTRMGRKSIQVIRSELLQKGVASDLIEEALDQMEEPDQTDLIIELIRKKHYRPEEADADTTRRVIQFLMRKGFSYSEIKKALLRLDTETSDV